MINILKTKIKKNSEIFALFVLIFLTVISTTYYNESKKTIYGNFKTIINKVTTRIRLILDNSIDNKL